MFYYIFIVVLSSIWVAIDSHKNQISSSAKPYSKNNGALTWLLGCLCIWIVAFPGYIIKRSKVFKLRSAPNQTEPDQVSCPPPSGLPPKLFNIIACSIIVLFFAPIVLSGCGSKPEMIVRNGTIQLDSSVTVGDAFDGYNYFGDRIWKSFEDQQKRRIVEFNGVLDFRKFRDSELEGTTLTSDMVSKGMKNLGDINFTYQAQFAISKDEKTFELKYSGIIMSGTAKDNGEKLTESIPDDKFYLLQHIYANKPEPTTWGFLLRSSLQ